MQIPTYGDAGAKFLAHKHLGMSGVRMALLIPICRYFDASTIAERIFIATFVTKNKKLTIK